MRRKLVAGNWKMNGSIAALAELDAIAAAAGAAPGVDVAVAVPFTLIHPAAARVPGLAIGAEDVHEADAGAHTGCVSAAMVIEAGARFTLAGHSERRADQGETSHDAWAKAAAAHRQGLQVACLEEIAYLQGFIGKDQLVARGKLFAKTAYGQNLLKLAQEDPKTLLTR